MPAPMFQVGRVGHVEPARVGDSFAGVQRTYNRGLRAQDINVHVTADGHVVPGHYDGLRANGFNVPGTISGSTLAELRELGIPAITNWFEWGAARDFAFMLEWKPDRHTTDAAGRLAWERVAAAREATGAKVAVMSIQAWAPRFARGRAARLDNWERQSKARLRVVAAAGLPTVLLWRRAVSADWWPIVSAVKSAPARVKLPAGVVRIGRGAAAPTPGPAPTKRRPWGTRRQRRRLRRLERIARPGGRRLRAFQRRALARLRALRRRDR